jgi:23S rRNA (pseudouridine1915-N3)-methyltransferase
LKISVLWFGRPSASPYERQIETYRSRVNRRWRTADQPLRPAGGREGDEARALALEAEAVRKHIPQGWRLVVLDEQGRSTDSMEFAHILADAEERATPGMVFVVGSDLGVHRELRSEAWQTLSLSPMTLPHLLARLVLWEQLFRATHILGAGRYHRHRVQ